MAGVAAAFRSFLRHAPRPASAMVLPLGAMTAHIGVRAFSAAPKDGAAKRPSTAYIHFCNEKRPAVTASLASKTGQEKTRAIMSALGKMWKELPTASKKPYEDAAQKEKSAYLKKFPDGPPPRNPRKEEKEYKEKKAPSAYNLFVRAFYDKTPMTNLPFAERSASVAQAWKGADKKTWQDKAAQEKLRLENSRAKT